MSDRPSETASSIDSADRVAQADHDAHDVAKSPVQASVEIAVENPPAEPQAPAAEFVEIPAPQFDRQKAIGQLKIDADWTEAVSRMIGESVSVVRVSLDKFQDFCNMHGKIHSSIGEVRLHFNNWLHSKPGKRGIEAAKQQICTIRRKREKEEERKREAAAEKPKYSTADDTIRRWGYDPATVTMAMVLNPEWRKNHPPVHHAG